MNKVFLITLFAFSVAACGTSSKQEYCNTTNWKDMGNKTGLKGQPADVVMKDQKSCAEVGVQIPLVEFKEGWEEGIQQYCSEENAVRLGRSGEKHMSENCPIEYRPKFLAAYEEGVKLKSVNKKIEKVEKQIDRADAEKEKLKREVDKKRQKISDLESQQSNLKDKKESLLETKQN